MRKRKEIKIREGKSTTLPKPKTAKKAAKKLKEKSNG